MYGPPADAPKATCSTCGATYVDWEDFSGPAHSVGECRDALVKRVATLESALRGEVVQYGIGDKHNPAYHYSLCGLCEARGDDEEEPLHKDDCPLHG